ncbi:DUF4913 domain-containing protein [Leifsonia shinshuensis]
MSDWDDDLGGLGGDVDETTGEVGTSDEEEPVEPEPVLYYGSVDEFVRVYLRSMYRRAINGRNRRWAAAWWKYPEAVARLEALWLSWEELRRSGPLGASVWWKDHADYHMAVLMDPDGPFYDAADGDQNRNQAGQPLPYEPPPEAMFPPEPHIYREPTAETG